MGLLSLVVDGFPCLDEGEYLEQLEQCIHKKQAMVLKDQDIAIGAMAFMMMVFMGLYTIGDTVIISRFVNTDALSALNIITPVINIIVGMGGMLATGGSAIVARKMGEGKVKRASQDFTLIVIGGAVLGASVAVVGSLPIDRMIGNCVFHKVQRCPLLERLSLSLLFC